MKIILMQDVYKKGVAGEVVEVAPGYARNYLIPRGLAVKATPGAMRQAENLRKTAVTRRAEREKDFAMLAEQIREVKLYFGVRAGETGKLYGSVTPGDIADQLKAQFNLEIDRRRIGDHPLRELGEFSVPVRLDAGLAPHIQVTLFREGQDPRSGEEAQVEPLSDLEPVMEEDVAEEAPVETPEEAPAE